MVASLKTVAYTVEEAAAKLDICEDYLKHDFAGLRRVFGKRKRMGVVELVHSKTAPPKDVVWVVMQLVTRDQRVEFAHACADRAVERHALRCGIAAVEEWARRWLSGEDRSAAAARAATDAARAASMAATWAASMAASMAAGAARVAAVRVAASMAADAARAAAARAAERTWQIRWLKRSVKRWGYERVS